LTDYISSERRWFTSNDNPDRYKAAKMIINDMVCGNLILAELPPKDVGNLAEGESDVFQDNRDNHGDETTTIDTLEKSNIKNKYKQEIIYKIKIKIYGLKMK